MKLRNYKCGIVIVAFGIGTGLLAIGLIANIIQNWQETVPIPTLEPKEINRVRTSLGISIVRPEKWHSIVDDTHVYSPFSRIVLTNEEMGTLSTKVKLAEINIRIMPGFDEHKYLSMFSSGDVIQMARHGRYWMYARGHVGSRHRRNVFVLWRKIGENVLLVEYYPGFETEVIPELIWKHVDTIDVPERLIESGRR